jgi:hypothetical protein
VTTRIKIRVCGWLTGSSGIEIVCRANSIRAARQTLEARVVLGSIAPHALDGFDLSKISGRAAKARP